MRVPREMAAHARSGHQSLSLSFVSFSTDVDSDLIYSYLQCNTISKNRLNEGKNCNLLAQNIGIDSENSFGNREQGHLQHCSFVPRN